MKSTKNISRVLVIEYNLIGRIVAWNSQKTVTTYVLYNLLLDLNNVMLDLDEFFKY